MKKIAIIGASLGQKKLCEKAKELGLYTIGFAWDKTEDEYKKMFSVFYPVSITEKEKIAQICKQENIDGVVSNASDMTAEVVSYVSSELGLNGIRYEDYTNAKNKFYVRQKTNNIPGITPVKTKKINSVDDMFLPCVVKPCVGHSKQGVYFVNDEKVATIAFEYATEYNPDVFIEQFISGKEYSIESISFHGQHQVVQITEKVSTGAPHFVEIGHIQPANISDTLKNKIYDAIPKILNAINFTNGASHIELKINDNEDIYLIEVNPRGGGDEISNTLVNLSTDFDYVKAMITVATGDFVFPQKINNINNVGICYLCQQSKQYIENIMKNENNIIENHLLTDELKESTTNYDRQGYILYKF